MSGALGCMLAAAVALGGAVWTPDEMEVPIDRQIPLLTRVLAFDRSLAGSGPLTVAVVYQERSRSSRQTYEAVVGAVERGSPSVQGRQVRVVPVPLTTVRALPRALRRARADVAYIAPLRAVDVGALARAAAETRVVTATGVRSYVRAGAAVGIGLRDGRPEILLNRRASEAAGADFSARLLQLATLVDVE